MSGALWVEGLLTSTWSSCIYTIALLALTLGLPAALIGIVIAGAYSIVYRQKLRDFYDALVREEIERKEEEKAKAYLEDRLRWCEP